MGSPAMNGIRAATAADTEQLLLLWASIFDEFDTNPQATWQEHARAWLARSVEDEAAAVLPLIEVRGVVVATAIGTLERGVPNPQCPRGRTVRLANVITLPEHRGRGYATMLVREVVTWARSIAADRVDLSTTPAGQRIYERAGFQPTTALRMKLVL